MYIKFPYVFSEIGQKPNQEDSLFPDEGEATTDTRVFLVCDGMGGHEHGEVASKCVADAVGVICSAQDECSTEEMKVVFNDALAEAYKELDKLDDGTDKRTMGTTLTFLAFCSDGALVAHIGDSRVYQMRPGKGILFQTRDHSLVNDLIASGDITEAEARNHPQRNVITRAVQPHQQYPAKATFKVITDIKPHDVFFMCCDGVIEKIDNPELQDILLGEGSGKERVERLRRRCKELNTRDNNSCYYIEIAESGEQKKKWSLWNLFKK